MLIVTEKTPKVYDLRRKRTPSVQRHQTLLFDFITGRAPSGMFCLRARMKDRHLAAYFRTEEEFSRLLDEANRERWHNIHVHVNPIELAQLPMGRWLPAMSHEDASRFWQGRSVKAPVTRLPLPHKDAGCYLRCNTLRIDVDALRAKADDRCAATDEEHERALAALQTIQSALKPAWWLMLDSGNGAQLLIGCDRNVDTGPAAKNWFASICERLDLSGAYVDYQASCAVHAQARVPGFENRKPADDPTRTCRRAKLLAEQHDTDGWCDVDRTIEEYTRLHPVKPVSCSVRTDVSRNEGRVSFKELLECPYWRYCQENRISHLEKVLLANQCREVSTSDGCEGMDLLMELGSPNFTDRGLTMRNWNSLVKDNKRPARCRTLERHSDFRCPHHATCPYLFPYNYKGHPYRYCDLPKPTQGGVAQPVPLKDARVIQKLRIKASLAGSRDCVHLHSGPPGIGKTHSAVHRYQPGKRILHLSLTHLQLREVEGWLSKRNERRLAQGKSLLTFVRLLGINDVPKCEHKREVEAAQASGVSFNAVVCGACLAKSGCPLYLQRTSADERQRIQKADILLVPVQHFSNPRFLEMYGNETRDTIVFDENPFDSIFVRRSITERVLAKLVAAVDNSGSQIRRGIEARQLVRVRQFLGVLTEMAREATAARSEASSLRLTDVLLKAAIVDRTCFAGVFEEYVHFDVSRKSLDTSTYAAVMRARNQLARVLWLLDRAGDSHPILPLRGKTGMIEFAVHTSIPKDKRIVYLDGTANVEIAERMFDRPVTVHRLPPVSPKGTTVQIVGGLYCRDTMWRGKHPWDEALKKLDGILRYHSKRHGSPQSLVVITWKKAASAVQEHMRRHHPGIELTLDHFGNIAGRNSLQGDVLVVLGGFRPPERVIRRMFEAIYRDPAPMETWNSRWMEPDDCDFASWEKGYADPRLQALLHYAISRELVQCAGRLRPLQHAGRTAYIVSQHPLCYPVERVAASELRTARRKRSCNALGKDVEAIILAPLRAGKDVDIPATLRKLRPGLHKSRIYELKDRIINTLRQEGHAVEKLRKGVFQAVPALETPPA